MLHELLPSIHQHLHSSPRAFPGLGFLCVLPLWGQPRAHLPIHRVLHGVWETSTTLNRWAAGGVCSHPVQVGRTFCSVTVGQCPGVGGQAMSQSRPREEGTGPAGNWGSGLGGPNTGGDLPGVLGQSPPDMLG